MNQASGKQTYYAYIGSYAEPEGPGLYACTYNENDGQLSVIEQISGLKDPTFLTVDDTNQKLYAISTYFDEQGAKQGEARSFQIQPDGKLSLLNRQPTVGPTCHITLDHDKRCLIVSSYHGGMVGVCPIEPDGTIGAITDVQQHEGSSVHPNQQSPHPHSVFLDKNNRYAICCDLGVDRIYIYKLDAESGRLLPHGQTRVQAGAGPRHLVFHPSQDYVYVINELNSTITVFAYDGDAGTLREIETVSTLPEAYNGDNACADIHISQDGNYLYGSNRGHDSIVVYRVDSSSGKLSLVEHVPAGGKHPRNFAISPDDRFVLVANRDTNNVVTFSRDAETGKLRHTGIELQVSKPVCVKFSRSANGS